MKRKYKLLLVFILIAIIFYFPVVQADSEEIINASCDTVFTPTALALITDVLGYFRILAPTILAVLMSLDFAKAVASNDNEVMKKTVGIVVKRVLATFGFFLVPTFVLVLLNLPGVSNLLAKDPLCTDATGTKANEVALIVIPSKKPLPGSPIVPPIRPNNPSSNGTNSVETLKGGKGYSHQIVIAGKTYKVYKQGRYSGYGFWGGTIASHGCGPTSVAIVASGYGKSVTPIQTSKQMSYGSLSQVRKALTANGIRSSVPRMVSSGTVNSSVNAIRAHLKTGKPVIVLVGKSTSLKGSKASRYTGGGHFMVLLGEVDGKLIIANPSNSSSSGTLEDLVKNYMAHTTRSNRGYILITS